MGLFSDVAEIKLLLQSLVASQQATLQLLIRQDQFIRTELRSIRISAAQIREELPSFDELVKSVKHVEQLLDRAYRLTFLPKPEKLTYSLIGETPGSDGMQSVIDFKVNIPPVPNVPNDVQALKLTVNGVSELLGLDVTSIVRSAPQGARTKVEAVYVDDAGLESPNPSVIEFDALDQFPPIDVGALSVEFLGERFVEDTPPADGSGSSSSSGEVVEEPAPEPTPGDGE